MSVLSGVSLAQLDESFRGCGRGHGVVDISAAAALAVPRLVDCAPRAQSGASRGQLVLIAHVEVDGVAMAIVVVASSKRWALRTLLTGSSTCAMCPPGSEWVEAGACAACAMGEYASGNGTVACKACPAFSTTSTAGATTVQSCSCIEGYIFDIDTTGRVVCQQCRNVLEFSTTRFAGATSADDCEVRGKKYEVQSTK